MVNRKHVPSNRKRIVAAVAYNCERVLWFDAKYLLFYFDIFRLRPGDGGVDLIAIRANFCIFLQCKNWRRKIGIVLNISAVD